MGANILKIFDSAKKNLIYYIKSAAFCINMRFFVSADNSSTDNRKKGFFLHKVFGFKGYPSG